MRKVRQPYQNSLVRKSFWIPTILVLVVVASAVDYVIVHDKDTSAKTQVPKIYSTSTAPNTKASTYTTQINGQNVQVPDTVPKSSVPNYTLITQNQNYEIQELNGAYTITLFPIVSSSSSESYTQQLHDYKQQALQYLTQSGVNVSKVNITYDPAAAAQD